MFYQMYLDTTCGLDYHDMQYGETPIGQILNEKNVEKFNEIILENIRDLFPIFDTTFIEKVLNGSLENVIFSLMKVPKKLLSPQKFPMMISNTTKSIWQNQNSKIEKN